MNLVNFVVWLSAGAVVGWFASRMVRAERKIAHKTLPDKGSVCQEVSRRRIDPRGSNSARDPTNNTW